MSSSQSSYGSPGRLLTLSAELNEAVTVQTAVTRVVELVETAFDQPVVSVWTYDPATGTVTTLGSSAPSSSRVTPAPDQLSESIVEQAGKRGDDVSADGTPEATVDTDPREPIQTEALVPVGASRVLRVGVTEPEGLDETGIATIEGIAATLQTTLARIDNRQSAAVGCDVARALFDQSDEATFVSDTDGALVAVNRAAVELTGRDRDALLTNGLPNIAGDTATEPVREHLERTVTGTPEPLTTTLEHAQDGRLTVELTSQPVDVDGASYVHTIAHDPSSGSQFQRGPAETPVEDDATALRQLNELTVGAEGFDETIERLLSIGRDNLGLDTGILSHVDGDDYEINTVVDATGLHEAGAVYDLGDTMCDATLAGDVAETLAFADIADTDHQNHPAAENVRAYIAAPVVVNGDTYGTVNFSMGRPRSEAFRPEEKEFVKLVAQWTGTEIERRHRFQKLERYKTILEAVDDPVYALDDEGYFTFVNEAAEREFGYDKEIIGRHPSVGMDHSDVERLQEQIEGLLATDARSTTTEFELETADGERKTVENRLALIGEEEFLGTAGVLRDITGRKERRRQLESFQRAVEEAADGIAILDGEEYTYVDQTHVEMYGFEDKNQLLGNTWRKLYDDDEVERLEGEAFPALEADGYWRGRVTGNRPDGSTFPAELSLTIIGDGRLVCTVRDETERRERERELDSFQRAVESARDGVAILDGDEYTYVDQSHVEMYGFNNKEQLLGNTWRKLYDTEEVERLEAEAFPALEADGYWRGMVTGSQPDGSTFPAELSLTIVEDGRLVCTVRDETERRERERELELKERAMDEATVGIQITDPTQEDNPLVYVNDGFERMTGYTSEDAIGRNPRFLQGEASDSEEVTRLREAIESNEPVSLELQNHRKDGTPYWSRLSVTPVTDEDGTLTNYVGIQQDVTERKERTQWLRQFLNEGPLMFIETREVDGEAIVESCNERLLDRLAYERAEVEGEQLASLYSDASSSKLREVGYERALSGDFGVNERELVGPDGESLYTLLRAVPRRDETNGTNALFVDISKRKERERQTEARVDLFQRIYEVTIDPQTGFEEKIDGLLEAGRDYLDLPYGFLAQIDMDDDPTAGTQTILEAVDSHERLQPGESGPLSESYCQRTIAQDDVLALTNAAESELVDDTAYDTFGLETYIGGKVNVGSDVYGTLCFASSEQRESSFDEFERSFVSLLGQWAGYEIERRDAREELRQKQERLELTLSGTNTGIAEWDLQTDTVTWNETLVELVGRDVESIEEFREAIHPDDRDRVQRELDLMLETGESWTGEFRIVGDHDDSTWLATRATPAYDDDGNPVRVRATGTDISDRKAEERERRRNERRFESLFDDPGMLVGLLDTDGTLLNVNATAMEYVEGTAADLHGEPFSETPWWNHSEELQNDLQGWIRRAADGEYVEYSVTHRTADGDEVYVDGTVRPVTDADGTVTSLLVSERDVTERERQRRKLQDRQRKLDLVLSNNDTSVAELDLEHGTVQWDQMAGDNNIGSPETFEEFSATVHPEDRQRVQSAVEALASGDKRVNIEFRFFGADESVVWVAAQAVPVTDDSGERTGKVVGIATDITELKQRERELEDSQQRMQALHGTTRKLLQTSDKDEAVRKALDTLTDDLGFYLAGVYLREGDELLKTRTSGHTPGAAPERIERGAPPWKAVETGTPLVAEDVTALDDDVERGDTTKAAYVPIADRGVVVVGAADSTRLGESEQRLVEVLAGNLSSVLDTLDREQSLRVSEQRYRSLAENIPNGAVLTFDENLEYVLAAGELLPSFGVEEPEFSGEAVGTVLADGKHELIPHFRAALDGDRTDRRIELRGRTLRVHIAPVDTDEDHAAVSKGLVLVQDVTEAANREQALFEEREQFQLLTESVDEYAFLTVDGDGSIQTWNAGAANVFEYEADTALGMTVAELHPESDRESGLPERLLQQARISGESAHEGWHVRADGSEFYADVRYAPLETDDGEFRGYAMIVQDLTDQRRQQRRTERFVEEANDVVTIVDTDGTIEYASGSADRILGYDPATLVGENLFDYLHPESREDTMEAFFTGLEDPKADIRAECRIESGDGEWLNIDGQYRNMLDDDAIGGMLLYLRDVTESKERARRFESIFNQTFQFTGLLEPDGTVIEANDAALRFSGLDRDEIVGNRLFDVGWWAHSESVKHDARDAIERAASGEFVRYETEVRGVDGLATIDFSVKPVRDDDDDVSLLVVEGRNVTGQQQQRRHLEVMQRVMRHNLRNDITKIRGWTQVMSEEQDVEKRAEQFETVDRILDKWEKMAEQMQEIRTVLKSQQGWDVWREAEALVEDAVASVREDYAEETILTDVTDPGLQVPTAFLEAVRELVENAAEASADAMIKVEVDHSADGWTEIYVRDDGPGMPEMEADVLENGEETPLNHGQGLGLWMVRMIVTKAGGDASVESTGDGTEVCLRLPARWTTEGEQSAETSE